MKGVFKIKITIFRMCCSFITIGFKNFKRQIQIRNCFLVWLFIFGFWNFLKVLIWRMHLSEISSV